MSLEQVRAYFEQRGKAERILVLNESSATVLKAAQALHTEPARIAKTLSFTVENRVILVVMAGDARVDNVKFRQQFHCKARMLSAAETEEKVGHAVGGVCPFALKAGVKVYLDASLKRFRTVFPACGSGNSAIELSLEELEADSQSQGWVDIARVEGPHGSASGV